jgi:hypothetical protein
MAGGRWTSLALLEMLAPTYGQSRSVGCTRCCGVGDDRAAAESLFDLAQIRLTIYSQTVRISLDKGEIAPILWKKVG